MLYLSGIQQTGKYLFKTDEGKMIGNFGFLNFHAHWSAEVRICTGEDPAKTVLAVSHTVNIVKQGSLAAAEHGVFKLLEYTVMFCIRERSAVFLLISQTGGAFPRKRLIFKSWLLFRLQFIWQCSPLQADFCLQYETPSSKSWTFTCISRIYFLVSCLPRQLWLISAVCQVKFTDRNYLKFFTVVFISVFSWKTAIFFSNTCLWSFWNTPLPL